MVTGASVSVMLSSVPDASGSWISSSLHRCRSSRRSVVSFSYSVSCRHRAHERVDGPRLSAFRLDAAARRRRRPYPSGELLLPNAELLLLLLLRLAQLLQLRVLLLVLLLGALDLFRASGHTHAPRRIPSVPPDPPARCLRHRGTLALSSLRSAIMVARAASMALILSSASATAAFASAIAACALARRPLISSRLARSSLSLRVGRGGVRVRAIV